MTAPSLLDKLAKLEEKASPTPWQWDGYTLVRHIYANHGPALVAALLGLLERMEAERRVVANGGMSASVSDFISSVFVEHCGQALTAMERDVDEALKEE